MAEKALRTLKQKAPGFFSDRDEPWSQYLTVNERSWFRRQREDFLALDEDMENESSPTKKKALEKEKMEICYNVLKVIDEFQERAMAYNLSTVSRLTGRSGPETGPGSSGQKPNPTSESHRKESGRGTAEKSKRVDARTRSPQEDYESETSKRVRLSDIETALANNPDDLILDDYMPRQTEKPAKKAPPRVKPLNAEEPMNWCPIRTGPEPPISKQPEIDPIVEGIKNQKDVEILLELKPLIDKYKCRDRVIKCLNAMKLEDSMLKCLKGLSECIQKSAAQIKKK